MFHYNEIGYGYDFGYYNRCELEYGESLADFIENVDEDIVVAYFFVLCCICFASSNLCRLEVLRIQSSQIAN